MVPDSHSETVSRRAFLGGAVAAAARGSAVVLGLPAILTACERGNRQRQAARQSTGDTGGAGGAGGAGDTAQNGFRNLSADEAAELQAIAARIMPNDDGTAGAEEAGVIYFMDNVLTEPEQLALLRDGLSDLQQRVQTRYGGGAANASGSTPNNGSGTPSAAAFHRLQPAQQDALLRDIEDGEFFRTVRFLTLAGMFSLPEYGGNQGYAGYQAIAYDARHAWAPPFGAYDGQQ